MVVLDSYLSDDLLLHIFRLLIVSSASDCTLQKSKKAAHSAVSVPNAVYSLAACEKVCTTFRTILCGGGGDDVWRYMCGLHFPWSKAFREQQSRKLYRSVFLALYHSEPPSSVNMFNDCMTASPLPHDDSFVVVAFVRQWNPHTRSLDVLCNDVCGGFNLSDQPVDMDDWYPLYYHRFANNVVNGMNPVTNDVSQDALPPREDRNVRMATAVSETPLMPVSAPCGELFLMRDSDGACGLLCRFDLSDPDSEVDDRLKDATLDGEEGRLAGVFIEETMGTTFRIGASECDLVFGMEVQHVVPRHMNRAKGWMADLQLGLFQTAGDSSHTSSLLSSGFAKRTLLNAICNRVSWK
tara:strand:- start:3001 stop:4056 length:1056 start_codon:yes stop_codon:yes gene_type:complete